MFDGMTRRRLIIVVTRTEDRGAKENWIVGFEKRNCQVRMVTPDGCVASFRGSAGERSYLIDDVNPSNLREATELTKLMKRVRPQPACVVMVGREDYDNVARVMDKRFCRIHIDGESMEGIFDYLAHPSEAQC